MVPVVAVINAVMVIVWLFWLVSVPMFQVPVLGLYVPWLVSDVYVSPVGSWSVIVTPVAVSGPLLVVVSVYVMYCFPSVPVYVFCVWFTCMSAPAGADSAHVAVLSVLSLSYWSTCMRLLVVVRLGVDVPDWITLTNIFSSTSPPLGMVPRFHVRLLFPLL